MAKVKRQNRDTSRDYYKVISVPEHIKIRYKHLNIDKGVKIVLYGEPMGDSRPRAMASGAVATVNLNIIKKIFKSVYSRSPFLQSLCVLSPYIITVDAYKKPSVANRKLIKSDKKIQKLFDKELLYDTSVQDVDNMIKLYNDLLISYEYRICVDDAFNVIVGDSTKILSMDERTEFCIYYSSDPPNYYLYQIKKSHKYYRYLISEKYMVHNKIKPKNFIPWVKQQFNIAMTDCKSPKQIQNLVKRTLSTLEEFSAELIKEIADMADNRFTKKDAQVKIMFSVMKDHPAAFEYLDQKLKEINDAYDETGIDRDYTFF